MKTIETPSATLITALRKVISRRKFKFAGCCAMALALAAPVHADDADGDGILDVVEGYFQGIENGFEVPVNLADFVHTPQAQVPDWSTSAADGRIEIWRTDFRDVPSYEGVQHGEINAAGSDTLFVELVSIPGSVLTWKVAHRGRTGINTARVTAGAPGDAGALLETMVTDNTAWVVYSGTYTVPADQQITRFSFEGVDAGGTANFIDGLEISGVSRDSDGDGTPDFLDTDSDDDGIPDNFETNSDVDGDDIPNYLDLDADGDGITDTSEGNVDTDADGIADYLDTDSDDDGLSDADEGSSDTDDDGTPDFQDSDSDGDGIPDATEGSEDTDGDGAPDNLDTDSDGDGILDATEGGADTDGDGVPNFLDTDSDGDGVSDSDEGTGDADGDGTPDFLSPNPTTPSGDVDSDADGIPDSIEGEADTDGDGTPDAADTDSDNDGVLDEVEAGANGSAPVDTDNDGVFDYIDLDSDNDGILDATEGSQDLDQDGVANYLDLDADNDGIADIIEARSNIADSVALDVDMDGVIDGGAAAFGANGLADLVETAVESGQVNYELANGDNDGRPDYKDLDSDNDGIFDVTEGRLADDDLNGVVDTIPEIFAVPADQDNDGVTDFRDLDSDNDGLTDLVETGGVDGNGDGRIDNFNDADNNGVDDAVVAVVLDDRDGDGLPNQLDLDSDQDSIPDLLEAGGIDADANGVLDTLVDTDGDGLSDELLITPLLANDSDGDGAPDFLDLDSDNDGVFDVVAAGNEDADNDGTVDGFTDPDGDGLFGGETLTPTPTPTPTPNEPIATGGIITGVSGGIGCSLSYGRAPVDPILPGMLLLAGLGFAFRRRDRSE